MIGRFLEISLHAPDILDSIGFWEQLGFRQVATNDVWQHPYAVLSDGRTVLGLHAYRFDHSPALTFVRQDLAQHLGALRALGIEFEFAKTADDQFHEAGFLSPDGQMVTLLESRTSNTPAFDAEDFSVLGRMEALVVPVRRIDEALPFWARLGLAVVEYDEDQPDTALLATGPLTLRLSEDRKLRRPALMFRSPDIDATARTLTDRQITLGSDPKHRLGSDPSVSPAGSLALESPEGLAVLILPN